MKPLLLPTLVGFVAGLFVFQVAREPGAPALLGGFLVLYALYTLIVHAYGLPQLRCSKAWAFPAAVLGAFIDMMFGGGGGRWS